MVDELDMNNGTVGMECDCSSSVYRYDGDLKVIKDVRLR